VRRPPAAAIGSLAAHIAVRSRQEWGWLPLTKGFEALVSANRHNRRLWPQKRFCGIATLRPKDGIGRAGGRSAALEPAFVIALEGLRPNPCHAQIAADQKTAQATAGGEAVRTLGRIFRGTGGRSIAFGLHDLLPCPRVPTYSPQKVAERLFAKYIRIALAIFGKFDDSFGYAVVGVKTAPVSLNSRASHFECDAHDPRRFRIKLLTAKKWGDWHDSLSARRGIGQATKRASTEGIPKRRVRALRPAKDRLDFR